MTGIFNHFFALATHMMQFICILHVPRVVYMYNTEAFQYIIIVHIMTLWTQVWAIGSL